MPVIIIKKVFRKFKPTSAGARYSTTSHEAYPNGKTALMRDFAAPVNYVETEQYEVSALHGARTYTMEGLTLHLPNLYRRSYRIHCHCRVNDSR